MDTNTAKIGRLPFFDFLKMFAMFMVLWGHCIQHLQTGEVWEEPMHKLIYSFHLPLVMMIAGFFSLSSFKLSFKELLKKKGSQLILPYFTWGVILYGGIYILQSIILETIMAEYIKVDTWGSLLANLSFDNYILFSIISYGVMVACAYKTKWIKKESSISFWLLGK